ncbi:MAG: thioredoxin domain-containing protein [Candidatus Binataceae bacterium]
MGLSTRIGFASAIAFCFIAFFAEARFVHADPATKSAASADALPADALKDSPSRYLQEASQSPIRWQPWSDATFALARKLKRPVLIDIGAVWCHWCHVMDDTTYSNPQVAAILNDKFVPIKVDMDQRPDVDAFYQNAAARLTGAGGWPLTCFTTPAGTLLYAAGYLPAVPREGGSPTSAMAPILERIATSYATDPAEVERQADAIAKRIASESPPPAAGNGGDEATLCREIIASLANSYDSETGGFGRGSGPRFYDFPSIRLAIAYGFFQHDSFRQMALESLNKIARGGVFDQLGGGFHRYSTDQAWRVPHFEKMAYDQAMALTVYSEAYQVSRNTHLLTVISAIGSYANETLLDPATHAFFADQDADSFKGDDGSYYTWTIDEVKKTLPADVANAAIIFYGMADSPALAPDGRIVLRRPFTDEEIAKQLGMWPASAKALQVRAKRPMLAVRDKRPAPPVDRAIMTDRNALMISGYLAASDAIGDRISRQIAIGALDFILDHLRDPRGGFYHVWSNGQASVSGMAADQVYLTNALLDAYQATGEEKYLKGARSLAAMIADKYRDRAGLIVNRAAGTAKSPITMTVAGAEVMYDQPMPSVQAEAAHAMRTLGEITSDQHYLKLADALLAPAPRMVGSAADYTLGTLGLALEERADGGATVAIVGKPADPRTQSLAETALSAYRPGKVVIRIDPSQTRTMPATARAMYEAAADRNTPLAFVCAGTACSKPSSTTEQLRITLDKFQVEDLAQSIALPAVTAHAPTTSP